MIALANIVAWLFIAGIFASFAWLVLDSKTGAKSVGPAPHIPAGLDLEAFRAKVAGVESERRGRASKCEHARRIDQREDGGMLWCWDCRAELAR